VVTTKQRRSVVAHVVQSAALSERIACRLLGVHRSLVRYRSRRLAEESLRVQLRTLALQHPRWGSPRLTWLLRRDGLRINHKRVERVYREEGLAIRRRSRKRVARARAELPVPSGPNERWSMDFMRDTLADGRVFRLFNVVDDCTRECLAIEVDTSLTGQRVVAVLERLAGSRGLPNTIVLDNGPEFSGRVLDGWAHRRGIHLSFIRPGRPVENAFIESFNGRVRDECLNQHWFLSLADARRTLASWHVEYNEARPHSGLGAVTPMEFAQTFNRPEQAIEVRLSA
jgi:putative transposase